MRHRIEDKKEFLRVAKSYSQMPEEQLFFMLGVSEFYKDKTDSKVKYSAPYQNIGQKFFEEKQVWLYELICNSKTRRPKAKFLENDWVALAGALVGDLTLGSVTVVVAILMKKGLNRFCSLDLIPQKKKPVKVRTRKP